MARQSCKVCGKKLRDGAGVCSFECTVASVY